MNVYQYCSKHARDCDRETRLKLINFLPNGVVGDDLLRAISRFFTSMEARMFSDKPDVVDMCADDWRGVVADAIMSAKVMGGVLCGLYPSRSGGLVKVFDGKWLYGMITDFWKHGQDYLLKLGIIDETTANKHVVFLSKCLVPDLDGYFSGKVSDASVPADEVLDAMFLRIADTSAMSEKDTLVMMGVYKMLLGPLGALFLVDFTQRLLGKMRECPDFDGAHKSLRIEPLFMYNSRRFEVCLLVREVLRDFPYFCNTHSMHILGTTLAVFLTSSWKYRLTYNRFVGIDMSHKDKLVPIPSLCRITRMNHGQTNESIQNGVLTNYTQTDHAVDLGSALPCNDTRWVTGLFTV